MAPAAGRFAGANIAAAQYAYLPKTETQPYWTLAGAYGLADEMFSGALGPTFVGHQFLSAGIGPADNPSGVWQCDGGLNDVAPLFDGETIQPCFAYPTLATSLDAKGTSWKYYTGQEIRARCGSPPSTKQSRRARTTQIQPSL